MTRIVLILGLVFLTGCYGTPYGTNATPKASASISDAATSATLEMGALGEFTFVCSHCHLADGSTTGTVEIHHTKTTENNFLVGALGALSGFIAGRVMH